jgi:outer membrane lipoprotein SlyB
LIIRYDEQDIARGTGRMRAHLCGAIEYGAAGQAEAGRCHKQVAALHR